MIPQIICLILLVAYLCKSAYNHGQSKGYYDFWSLLFGSIVAFYLLYLGGFWDCFIVKEIHRNIFPQILYLLLLLYGLCLSAYKDGQPEGEWNFWLTLIGVILDFSILYWGGFWDCFIK
jgi:uncharacterized membrane protein YhdT